MPNLMSMLSQEMREIIQFDASDKIEDWYEKNVDVAIEEEKAKHAAKMAKSAKKQAEARMAQAQADAMERRVDLREAKKVFDEVKFEAFKDQQATLLQKRLEAKGYTF